MQKKSRLNQASVPVTLLSDSEIELVESPFGRELLRYAFKGVFTFKKICKLHLDRKEGDIKAFYEIAVRKGLVFMLDMVNLNNVYVLTQKIFDYV